MDHHKVKAVLNTACIFMCGISKFPQIKTNLQAKSVEGLSITALFIDVLRYKENSAFTISFSFHPFSKAMDIDSVELMYVSRQNFSFLEFFLKVSWREK